LASGLSILGVLTFGSEDSQEHFSDALVSQVTDGDTIVLDSGERVRYLGINTPESFGEPECGAEEATALNRALVEGKVVELLPGPEERDSYDRLLRYVFSDGVFVNAQLVREGLARAQGFHPKERFRQVLVQLEEDARTAQRGLWSSCDWK
jgi:micrococcal nuclease